MAIITLTTDFGTSDPFVGIMKGVIASRAPLARVIDVTHGVPPQCILAGALILRAAVPYFPPGTIHVAVIDPGVGSGRRPLCIEAAGSVLVGPDNGLLSLAAPAATLRRIVHVTDERVFLSPRSTFDGRDVFAPVAAALATGTVPAALGVEVDTMERLSLPPVETDAGTVRGRVLYVDHFGNLITNVPGEELERFRGRSLSLSIRGASVPGLAPAYSSVARGEPVALVNSWGLVEIAVRDGSAGATLGAGEGDPVVIAPGG